MTLQIPEAREEIKLILEKRISSYRYKSNKLRSSYGREVLHNMQNEYEKKFSERLKNSLAELKLQNERIGSELEKILVQSPSLKPNQNNINQVCFTAKMLLMNEGISGQLCSQLEEDCKDFLEISPINLPGIIDRSIKDIRAILQRLEHGGNVHKYLVQESELAKKIRPFMDQFWNGLDTYREIMGLGNADEESSFQPKEIKQLNNNYWNSNIEEEESINKTNLVASKFFT